MDLKMNIKKNKTQTKFLLRCKFITFLSLIFFINNGHTANKDCVSLYKKVTVKEDALKKENSIKKRAQDFEAANLRKKSPDLANVYAAGDCVEIINKKTGKMMIGKIIIKKGKPGDEYDNTVYFKQDIQGGDSDQFYGRALNSQVSKTSDGIILNEVAMHGVGDYFNLSLKLTADYLFLGLSDKAPKYKRINCPGI